MRRTNRKSWLLLAILAYLASGTCFFRLYHSRPSNTRLRTTEDQGKPLLRPPFQFYRLARRAADELRVDVTTDYLSNISMLANDFNPANREDFQAALRQAMMETKLSLVLGGQSLGKSLIKDTVMQVENAPNSKLTILDVDMRGRPSKELFVWIFDKVENKCQAIETMEMEETKSAELEREVSPLLESKSPKRVLTAVITMLKKGIGNATCILVDEANLALPGQDEAQAREDLQYFVMLAKQQSRASVVLISSEFAYPYHLQKAGINLREIENIIFANEIPKEEMVEVMVTKWDMSQELAEEFYLYFGGDVHLCKRAVEKLIQKGDSFDPIADVLDSGGLSMCTNDPDAREHLQNMADQGWSPVQKVRKDAAAELIAKENVGCVLPRRAQIFDSRKDMFIDEYEDVLVPAGTLMRWKIAKALELPLDTSMSAEPKRVWVCQLREDDIRGFEFAGNAFQVKDKELQNIDDLKKAINPSLPPIEASKIDIYLQQEDGGWEKEGADAEIKRGALMSDCYGFLLPD